MTDPFFGNVGDGGDRLICAFLVVNVGMTRGGGVLVSRGDGQVLGSFQFLIFDRRVSGLVASLRFARKDGVGRLGNDDLACWSTCQAL